MNEHDYTGYFTDNGIEIRNDNILRCKPEGYSDYVIVHVWWMDDPMTVGTGWIFWSSDTPFTWDEINKNIITLIGINGKLF